MHGHFHLFVRDLEPGCFRHLIAPALDPVGRPLRWFSTAYCNSCHLACGPWFVMSELPGHTNARLYDGSMHQWTLERRPVEGAIPLQ